MKAYTNPMFHSAEHHPECRSLWPIQSALQADCPSGHMPLTAQYIYLYCLKVRSPYLEVGGEAREPNIVPAKKGTCTGVMHMNVTVQQHIDGTDICLKS